MVLNGIYVKKKINNKFKNLNWYDIDINLIISHIKDIKKCNEN